METILCPTDFSSSSENALRYADELAQRMNSRVVLFHTINEVASTEIFSSSGVPYAEPIPNLKYLQTQREKLESLKMNLEHTGWGQPKRYETKINFGLPKNTIPEVAQEEKADMIVLGNEGAEGLKEIFENSVAADVIKYAPCPVLVIPPNATFKPFHKIVFATDLLGEPFIDVSFVTKLASLFGAEILFLHILTNDSPALHQRAQAELDRLHKQLPYPNVTFYTDTNAHIEEGISQFTRRYKADMLVMGYHPRSFWQHLFTQDYTQEMAYHTYLPLLVIHYQK